MVLKLPGSLVLVGAGRMGGALLDGWLARGLDPKQVFVQDPAPSAGAVAVLESHGISRGGPAGPAAAIVLAVKPQVMDAAVPPLGPWVGPETLVLSIAAGRTIASLEAHLPPGTAVVRAMPNTPAAIGRGISVCVANAAAGAAQRVLCEQLLEAGGEVAWIADEALMDAVTAVSGSGPAYVFLLTECLAKAGRAAGLDAGLADRLARATVAGAGELMRQSGEDAQALREAVTSPGGTTAAALQVLTGPGGLEDLLARAVLAGANRSRELAK